MCIRDSRGAEALGQAHREGVEERAVTGQRHPVGDVRVPDPGAVAVQGHVLGVGHRTQVVQGGERDHATTAQVVGLLDGDRRGRHRREAGRADHRGDPVHVQRGAGRRPGPGRDAAQHRGGAQLVRHHVRIRPGQQLPTGRRDELQRDLVGHRAGRGEQRRLVPEELRDVPLERVDGRVVPEHVVADRRGGHGLAHPVGGAGHGVRSQINHGASPPPGTRAPGSAACSGAGRRRSRTDRAGPGPRCPARRRGTR